MRRHAFAALLVLASLLPALRAEERAVELEIPDDPPGQPARDDAFARSPAMRMAFGSYESIQVNVDPLGSNVVGDAANEPSIAVNPQNPENMVIGWRQFDTVSSNFRQAGWGYTFDGGRSWTFPGVLTPGVFRSDPSLDADGSGTFFYQSLKGDLRVDVFRSINGGITWSAPVAEFGGDKNWLAVDRTGGASDGLLYGIWQRFGGACCNDRVFTRSIDHGLSFQQPVPVALSPVFGTMAVGPDGAVYATGIDGTFGQDTARFVLSASANAGDPSAIPTFVGRQVNLGGSMGAALSGGPNPAGLLGQPNVFVNFAPGPRHGEVYIVGSVVPAGATLAPPDPMNVYLIRSQSEGGWSSPVRINDDTVNAWQNWQWMAAAAAAPNGRIDAVWLDTRNGAGNVNLAQLFYAYSWDGGSTWSPNVAVTPTFDTSLGYPNQFKMGDYITIVAGEATADVAYTATFNSEQDVYHVRIFPDCDGNGVSDVTDIATPSVFDCNLNHVPDGCESAPACLGAGTMLGSLVLGKAAGGALALQWGAACGGGGDDYAVYEGILGSFASHAPRACTTAGETSGVLTPTGGDTYYLVVATQADREGSYGVDSAGVERPAAATGCFPQEANACSR